MLRYGRSLPLLAFLAGCLGAPPALPSPPPIPPGWMTVEMSGLRTALPREWPVEEGQEDIVVNVLRGPVEPYVYLFAQGPSRVEPQPEGPYTSEEMTGWILDRISTSRPDRYSRSELRLPAGPAVEVRFHYDGEIGHFEAVEGAAYAISTGDGIAYLQIHMSESLLGEFGAAMAEVPLHLSLVGGPD